MIGDVHLRARGVVGVCQGNGVVGDHGAGALLPVEDHQFPSFLWRCLSAVGIHSGRPLPFSVDPSVPLTGCGI